MLLHLPSWLAILYVLTDFENRWASDMDKWGLPHSMPAAWCKRVPCQWQCCIMQCGNAIGVRPCKEGEGWRGYGVRWPQWTGTNSPGVQHSEPRGCVCYMTSKSWKENISPSGVKMKTLFFPLLLCSSLIYRFWGLQCFSYSASWPWLSRSDWTPRLKLYNHSQPGPKWTFASHVCHCAAWVMASAPISSAALRAVQPRPPHELGCSQHCQCKWLTLKRQSSLPTGIAGLCLSAQFLGKR